jgi:hypothetical protein
MGAVIVIGSETAIATRVEEVAFDGQKDGYDGLNSKPAPDDYR